MRYTFSPVNVCGSDNPFQGRTDRKAVWQTLLTQAQLLIGPSAMIACSHDPRTGQVTAEAVLGLGPIADEFLTLTGRQVLAWSAPLSEKARPYLLSGQLHIIPGGLYDLLFGQLPRGLARWLGEFWDIPTLHSIGVVHNGQLLGALNIALREGGRLTCVAELTTLARQCAAALFALGAGNHNGVEPAVGLEPTTT